MTSEPTSRNPNADDGSWESLAENLLGIDFKQTGLSDDLAAEDLSLDEELLAPAAEMSRSGTGSHEAGSVADSPATEGLEQAPARVPETSSRPPLEEDLSFDEDLGFDAPPARDVSAAEDVRLIERAVPASREPEDLVDDDADAADDPFDAGLDLAEGAEEVEADESEPDADDTYWDALKDWEWDDTDEAAPAPARGGRRPERAARTPRYVPRAVVEPSEPAWAEGRADFIDDPEFGSGLVDDGETRVREPQAAPAARRDVEPAPRRSPEGARRSPEPEAEQRDRGDDRGRRRRRRGRPEAAEPPPRHEAREEPEEPDMQDMDVDTPAAEDIVEFDQPGAEGDEFGLGLDIEPQPPRESGREPRRGGRRRSRRREQTETQPAPAPRAAERREPAAAQPDWGGEPDEELEEAEADEAPEAAGWENIPTWEEAVALLVHAKRTPASDSPRGPGSDGDHGERGDRGERSSRPRGPGGRRGRRRR